MFGIMITSSSCVKHIHLKQSEKNLMMSHNKNYNYSLETPIPLFIEVLRTSIQFDHKWIIYG